MEKIILKNSGSIEKFIEWIERFKGEISKDSLVIEVDTVKNLFISKICSPDRSIVRYSEIPFSDANFELVSVSDGIKNTNKRVLIGIFMFLSKFIDVLKTFSTSDSFSMEIESKESNVIYDFGKAGTKTENEFCAIQIVLKSPTLTMVIPGSSINATEMKLLNDDNFNQVIWYAPNPISLKLTGDLLKNLVSISDIFVSNEKLKNFMEFYTVTEDGKKILKVRDPRLNSYDYVLGEVDGSEQLTEDISVNIYRERFLLAVKNAFSDTVLTISASTPNRLLIQLGNGDTKTIIARVNRENV